MAAQMADPRDAQRPQYPPPDDPIQSGYYSQQSPQRPAARDDRSPYPPPEPVRQQYPDPRAAHPYPPPQAWPGQHGAYPHYPDPAHPAYAYPPRPEMGQPPPPMQPDAYRLPPVYAHPHAGYYASPYPPPAPAAAPRQRTAIACKYCRKRKIRCSGYDSSPDGRCQNCVRFNQQCLFHPVSSQAAFVPANAVYGPNAARAPIAGQGDGRAGQNGHHYPREGDQPPMLYGAHGQPLGPAGPHGQPQYSYPPPPPHGYPPAPYPYSYPPAGPPYDAHGQAQAAQHDERVSLKRPPPDDDPHNENSHASQSPHPSSRARNSTYDSRQNSSGSYDYADHTSGAPTSPATSTMSYQSFPQQQARYPNGNQSQKGNVSPSGLTPQSAQSYNSPRQAPAYDDGRTPPPNQPGSAGSSTNGRSGMKVHEMIEHTRTTAPDLRGKNDNDMLSKLDGKK
ncbi:Fungal Zn2-Cys6 binuclear cluster domain-containing protein isoform 1 [Cladophialophora immunda]|nr:Fungal Zn2-Cys6 binuclear cluster domain-containing protein isoform 1 [Cladophialophora immunda]